MLRQRILTALVLVPLFIGGFLWLPTAQIALVLAALVILAAWEWTGLMGLDSMPMRAAYIALVGLLLPFSARVFEMAPQLVLAVVLIAWLLAMGWVARFDGRRSLLSSGAITLLGLVGLFVLIPTWLSLVELHGQGPFGRELLIYLMLLVWGADSGAYFAGRQWGRHKLAPLVSPGKSWEGAYGALASSLVLAILAGVYFGLEPARTAASVGRRPAAPTIAAMTESTSGKAATRSSPARPARTSTGRPASASAAVRRAAASGSAMTA